MDQASKNATQKRIGDLRIDRSESVSSRRNGSARPLRIALYSHDAMGVGHVRRNLLIGQSLAGPPVHATSLMVCGVHEATAFSSGHGIDCLTLPTLEKHDNDDYRPRDLRLPQADVSKIRAATLTSALGAMEPDVLIVDKVPRGLRRDLEPALELLRGTKTKLVFGMRDILDCPQYVADEWRRHDYERFVLDNYDAVWIYGDRRVFDPIAEYGLESLRPKARFLGYFNQVERLRYAKPLSERQLATFGDLSQTVLCMVGGGQDGGALARAFAAAKLPTGLRGLLVTGPLMPTAERRAVEALVVGRDDMQVVSSVPDADLLVQHAARVICMGGYNSMLSVVSFQRPSLIVPRVKPRSEQLIRARRFAELGLVEMLHQDKLTSDQLTDWLASDAKAPDVDPSTIDLGGLQRIPSLLEELGMESAVWNRG